MIRDVTEFRRTGVASRWVDELSIPVEEWRAAMRHVAHRDGARIRTFLVSARPARFGDQLVFAVRIEPPPDPAAQGRVPWWHVDELRMPLLRWRAVVHGLARLDGARAHTFLAPRRGAGANTDNLHEQRLFVAWVEARPEPASTTTTTPRLPPAPRPVTDLTAYLHNRSNRSACVARHPSALPPDDCHTDRKNR